MVKIVITVTNVDQCVDFITNVKEGKVWIILPEIFSKSVFPIRQLDPIDMFCENNERKSGLIILPPRVLCSFLVDQENNVYTMCHLKKIERTQFSFFLIAQNASMYKHYLPYSKP
jgi:hypothetical protein